MGNRYYAAIDIGTNAVRLLIKEVNTGEDHISKRLDKVLLLRVPLRLGFDVFSLGCISDVRAMKLLRLMKSFRQLLKIYEVSSYRACATSAMRESSNGKHIIKKIKKETDIDIEIIDGQEEAGLIYNNHIECMEDRTGNYIYVDVGGGSTEVNLLSDGELMYSFSYDIGTIRMLTNAVKKESWQRMKENLSKLTASLDSVNIIGSGGNINKLYRLAVKKNKEKQYLPVSSLQTLYKKLRSLTPIQRQEQYGLKEDRADVIVPAAEIFLVIAKIVKADYIHVPVIGLADGIIDSLYSKDMETTT